MESDGAHDLPSLAGCHLQLLPLGKNSVQEVRSYKTSETALGIFPFKRSLHPFYTAGGCS